MLTWQGVYGHLSYEKQQVWLLEMGGIEIGPGTLCATSQRVSARVSLQVDALSRWVKPQPQVQVDESALVSQGSQRMALGLYWGRHLRVSCRRYQVTQRARGSLRAAFCGRVEHR